MRKTPDRKGASGTKDISDIERALFVVNESREYISHNVNRLYSMIEKTSELTSDIAKIQALQGASIAKIEEWMSHSKEKIDDHIDSHWKWFSWTTGSLIGVTVLWEKIKAIFK